MPPNPDPFKISPCELAITSLCSLLGGWHSTFWCPLSGSPLTHASSSTCLVCLSFFFSTSLVVLCCLCPCVFLLLYRTLGKRTELKLTCSLEEFWQSLCHRESVQNTSVLMYIKLELLRQGPALHELPLPLVTTMDDHFLHAFNHWHLLHGVLLRCGLRGRSLSLCWCPWLKEIKWKIRIKSSQLFTFGLHSCVWMTHSCVNY